MNMMVERKKYLDLNKSFCILVHVSKYLCKKNKNIK